MEQNTLEEKIKLEKDIADLQRSKKIALRDVEQAKYEFNSINALSESKRKDIEVNEEYLKDVRNEIAGNKLDWAQQKNNEWKVMQDKIAEADNIIKRKKELNHQEEEITKKIDKNTEILNETRRLELKIKDDQLVIEKKEKDLLVDREELKKELKEFNDKKAKYKEMLIKSIKEWQEKL